MDKQDWTSLLLLPAVVIAGPSSTYAAEYLNAEQAQKTLFPEADKFIEQPIKLTKEQKKEIKSLSGLRQRWDEQAVWRVKQDNTFVGWFIVDDVVGKHEFITYAAALSPDGHVIGIDIMSYRETHGDEIREASWREHLKGKTLDDRFKLDEDVPNISGATLSCRNVMDGVKRLLSLQQVVLSDEIL